MPVSKILNRVKERYEDVGWIRVRVSCYKFANLVILLNGITTKRINTGWKYLNTGSEDCGHRE